MAATTLVSSVLGSRMFQRKPTAATCRPQGAPAAPGMSSRRYTRSTCPPFRLRPSSGKKEVQLQSQGNTAREIRTWGSVPKFEVEARSLQTSGETDLKQNHVNT